MARLRRTNGEMTPNEEKVLRLILARPDAEDREIGEAAGLQRQTVSRIRNNDPVKAHLAKVREKTLKDADEIFRKGEIAATRRFMKIFDRGSAGSDRDVVAAYRLYIERKREIDEIDDRRRASEGKPKGGLLLIPPCFRCKHTTHEGDCEYDGCQCSAPDQAPLPPVAGDHGSDV